VAIHRVDEVAARKQPVPGPLPSQEELLEIRSHGQRRPSPRRQPSVADRRHEWSRSVRRFARSKRGRWILIALSCLAVLLIGLLGEGFLSSPAPSVAAPDGGYAAADGLSGSASPSSPANKKDGSKTGTLVSDPVAALRAKFPDNPLNHLHGPGVHQVVISAHSAAPITLVGYLVPTGLGPTYGVLKRHPHSWSISEQALGRGYLAAIFIQAGRDGVPITCSISVDGKVTNSQTTSGGYGRAICLG
jgi:hypothetical protein